MVCEVNANLFYFFIFINASLQPDKIHKLCWDPTPSDFILLVAKTIDANY